MKSNKKEKYYTPAAFGLTIQGTVCKISEPKDYEDHVFSNASIAINNALWYIGGCLDEKDMKKLGDPDDGVVWCQLSFKDHLSDRLQNLKSSMDDSDKIRMIVGGHIVLNEYKDPKTKKMVVNGIRMYVNNFWLPAKAE